LAEHDRRLREQEVRSTTTLLGEFALPRPQIRGSITMSRSRRAEVDVRVTARPHGRDFSITVGGSPSPTRAAVAPPAWHEHMPSSHPRYADWTPDRFRRWARTIGPKTEALITAVPTHQPHPDQGLARGLFTRTPVG
jgi:hypothetical protein